MPIVKVIEVLADSSESWEDAARQALHEASKTVKKNQVDLRKRDAGDRRKRPDRHFPA